MSEVMTLRLDEILAKEIKDLAITLDRSKTYIVKKAIEEYMEEYQDYLIAMERWNDKDDEIIDGDDLRNSLGL